MNRSVRLVSLLRWTTVAMHTAAVVSICVWGKSPTRSVEALLMWIDVPAAIVPLILANAFGGCLPPSLAIRIAAFLAVYGLLGGLQWYLIASLFARWTCGFQRTISVASKQFVIAIALGVFLVVGCGVLPLIGHLRH